MLAHTVTVAALSVALAAMAGLETVTARTCVSTSHGQLFYGQSLANSAQPSLQACQEACKSNSQCSAYTYNPAWGAQCALWSTQSPPYEAFEGGAAFTSGYCVSDATARQQCLPTEKDVDYAGADVGSARAATSAICCDQCGATAACNAYTWSSYLGGTCYMKAVKTSGAPATGTLSLTSGQVYKCQRPRYNEDIVGEDLGSVLRSDWTDCCGVCRSTTGCVAFTWNEYNGGTCWLKTGAGNYVAGSGTVSAIAV